MDEHVENTVNESVTYISLCLQYQFSFQLVEVARNLVVTQGSLIIFEIPLPPPTPSLPANHQLWANQIP